MEDIPLHQLRVFHTVARHRSYSRAGRELALSQPAVSRQVLNLERLLGLRLFNRRGRHVDLTDAGRGLYAYADQVFQLVREAGRAMDAFRNLERGRVRLGLACSVAGHALQSVLKPFASSYPEIVIEWKVAPSREVQQLVLDGRLDLCLAGPEILPGLHIELSRKETLQLFLPAGHSWTAGLPPDRRFLNGETLLLTAGPSGVRGVVESFLRQHGLTPRTLEVPDWGALRDCVAAGAGIAFMPEVMGGAACVRGVLVRAGSEAGSEWEIPFLRHLMSAKERPLIPAAINLVNFVGKQADP